MTRTADARRREELLDAIVDYVSNHGLSDLSLRPLAKELGSSPRVLLYYFGSKEQLVSEIITRVRRRQHEALASMRERSFEDITQACLAMWDAMLHPDYFPLYRLFFEVFGLALRQPDVYRDFLDHVVEDWLAFFSARHDDDEATRDDARVWATMLLAGFRGFLMDVCATADRQRVSRALRLWLSLVLKENPC